VNLKEKWTNDGLALALCALAVAAAVLVLIQSAHGMSPFTETEKPQEAKSKESVEETTETSTEAGDKSEIVTEIDKRLTTFQESIQKQIQANRSANSKMQDQLGNVVKGVETIEQHTTSITKNVGISAERQNLEKTRLTFRFEMMISIAGAMVGLLIAGWFAPAPNMNRLFMLGGIGAGILITAASVANAFWG